MSLETARAALVDALSVIPEVSVYGWPQQNANLPMIHVLVDEIDADFVLDSDKGRYRFLVRVIVSRADQENATALLDPLLAPSGDTPRGVINDDPTLGGAVDSARVESVRPDREVIVAGTSYLGADISVDVIG